MNTVIIQKKSYLIPSSWNEINHTQLVSVAPLIFGAPETLLFRQGLAIVALIPELKKVWSKLIHEQAWDLMNLVKWIFDDMSGKSILRSFFHEKEEYHLPEDNLRKESIIAFSFADRYFQNFIDTKNPVWLDSVIASIARQKGSLNYPALQASEGDNREHFSTSRTNDRAKAFKTLDPGIKSTILLFFMGSKRFIHKQYEILFTKKEDSVNDAEKPRASFGKKKIPKPDYGWVGIIYDLAELKTFGNFDHVKHQFLHTCCYYLTKKRYEHEESSTTS